VAQEINHLIQKYGILNFKFDDDLFTIQPERIKKIFSLTDFVAGICFFSVMLLILINILMRKLFTIPIMGTYELVGLITATGIGLALANCEIKDGNIAMSIITDRMPKKAQEITAIIIFLLSLGFWAVIVFRLFVYGNSSLKNGWVSSTSSIPIYPFIFILGFNAFCLCLVLILKLANSVNNVIALLEGGKQK
jgi:TRAP-type C4-dicarboxylate transport system permease small subunit